MATQEFSGSSPNKESDRALVAESTCCYRLRYGKSQMEFRVGIVECDRFFIEAGSIGRFYPELNETRLNRKPPAPQ
jgi:hypothetical protein